MRADCVFPHARRIWVVGLHTVAQRDYADAQSHFNFKFKELLDAYATFSLGFPDPLLQNMNATWEV